MSQSLPGENTVPAMSTSRREPRVLFMNQIYPPAFGGGGQYLALIRKAITRAGFESLVLAGNRGIKGQDERGVIRLPTPGGERFPRLGCGGSTLGEANREDGRGAGRRDPAGPR